MIPLLVNNPYYNLFSTPNWTQVLMPANSVASVWLYSIPVASDVTSQKYRLLWVQPQWVTLASNPSAGAINTAINSEKLRLPSELLVDPLFSSEIIALVRFVIDYTGGNWRLRDVSLLSGNKFSQVSSPSGNFLSTVAVDGVTITGSGVVGDPLVAVGGSTSRNVDGGTFTSIYLPSQTVNGGSL